MCGAGLRPAPHITKKMIELTREELKKFDGKNGRRAYIALNGLIYDVTDSFLWQNGRHFFVHTAGQDLTEELESAPHGHELLSRVPVVGRLSDE